MPVPYDESGARSSSVDRPTEFVQSLERGLAVIRAFGHDSPQMTLSDVARVTGMTRAAARRFLLTLEHLGYVASDGRHFHLRPRVLELGYAYLSSFTVAEVAQDHLEQLANTLHESCSASVLDGADIVYVARAATNRIMTVALAVGARLPAYCTSMGRVLLSALPPEELEDYLTTTDFEVRTERTVVDANELRAVISQVRDQGWCLQDQELEHGVRSLAVPLHDADGRVIAAANISAHAARVSLTDLRDTILPQLRACADAIDADLRSRR